MGLVRVGVLTMALRLPIIDGERNHGTDFDTHVREFVGKYARRMGVTLPPRAVVATASPVAARIDAGRWIVECPDCHDAQYVWPDEAAPVFMCVACFNVTVGGSWRPVTMPSRRDRNAIEAALLARPLPGNRHWQLGETAAALRAENRQHGIEG